MDGGGGDNMDMCEYVFNPLMRHMQAMQRLISMMRDSQQSTDCNDVECFSPNNPNQNPLLANPNSTNSLFSSTWFLATIWFVFVLLLFLFRPSSFRRKNTDKKQNSKSSSRSSHSTNNRSYYGDDDDDNSTVS